MHSASSGPIPRIAAGYGPSPGTCRTRRHRREPRKHCPWMVCATCSPARKSKARNTCSRRWRKISPTTWSTWIRHPKWRFSAPDFLDRAQHQRARGGHRVFDAGEDRRLATQQAPVLAPQDALQVFEVAVDGFHVRVAAAVQDLEIAVGAVEFAVEALGAHVEHELRCLAQQVEA